MGPAGRHAGLHLGREWTLVVLGPGAGGGSAADASFGAVRVEVATPGAAVPAASSPVESVKDRSLLAGLGLSARVVSVPAVLYLLDGLAAKAKPCILPGTGAPREGILSTTWLNLVRSQRGLPTPSPVLALCAAEFLRAVVSRLEETTGSLATPCDTVTVSVDGSGSADYYDAVARAAEREFGVRPTFLWAPTACAGWALASPAVRTRLLEGGDVSAVVPWTAGPASVSARHTRDAIRTVVHFPVGAADSDAAGDTLHATIAPVPGVILSEPFAAVGAALWGWWRAVANRAHLDHTLGKEFVLLGNEPEPAPDAENVDATPSPTPGEHVATAAETALAVPAAQPEEAGVRLVDVTPPAEPAAPGIAVPRWLARAVELTDRLFGPMPLNVCAHLPWSGAYLTAVGLQFSPDDVLGLWRSRFAVAVRLAEDGNAGIVVMVRPASSERIDVPFTLLPADRNDPPRGIEFPAEPSYAAVFESFRPLPTGRRYNWVADAASEAMLALGPDWATVPGDLPVPLRLHLLRFAAAQEGERPLVTVDPQPPYSASVAEVQVCSPGLTRYALDIAFDERGSGVAPNTASGPTDVGLASADPQSPAQGGRELILSTGVGPVSFGVEDTAGTAVPRKDSQAPSEGSAVSRIAWSVRFAARDADSAGRGSETAASNPVRIGGEIRLAPANYGVVAELQWGPGAADVASPYPLGRPVVSGVGPAAGKAVPMAVGVADDDDGTPLASRLTAGWLRLHNLSDRPLRVWPRPTDGVRVAAESVIVPAGRRVDVEVYRRRTLITGDADRFLAVLVRCIVEPVATDGAAAASLDNASLDAPAIGPPADVYVGMDVGVGGRSTFCLPAHGPVELALSSWVPSAEWQVPVDVAGAASADVRLAPAGRPSAAVRGRVPAAKPGAPPTRRTHIIVPGQPPMLLDWFPGPAGALSGTIEVRYNAAAATGLAIPIPIRCSIAGAVSVTRTVGVRHDAGLPLSLPFDLLMLGHDFWEAPLVRWRWDSPQPPYPIDCALAPPDADRPSESDAAPPLFDVRGLGPAAIDANRDHLRRWVLNLRPAAPSGWEQGTWRAAIVVLGSADQVLDEVPVTYTASPLIPRLGVRLRPGGPSDRVPTFVFTIANSNLYRAVTITAMELSAEVRTGPFTVGRVPFTVDEGPPLPERLAPGESRSWKGRLAGGRWLLPNFLSLRRNVGRRANVDLKVTAECEGRAEGSYEYRAQGEVEIS